ncbi:MAG: hypothetical protein ABI972_26110 [Acidobacteriota bacterium]
MRVAELIHNGRLNWWFAREFYPVGNEKSSQPIQIYAWLHQAKATGRPNRKTKRLQANLLNWLNTWRDQGLVEKRAYELAYLAITQAFENGAIRPSLYFLADVMHYTVESEPDEFRALNLAISAKNEHKILPHRLESRPGEAEFFPATGW